MTNTEDRWLVERSDGPRTQVLAAAVRVSEGALIFTSGHGGRPVLIIAAGQWLTCSPEVGA